MSLVTIEDMAKKKAASPRDDWERKPLALQVRGSAEWKAWLEEAAAFSRSSVAQFIDQAATTQARLAGFDKPPPER